MISSLHCCGVLFIYFYFIVVCVYVCLYHVCVWGQQRPEEGIGFPETVATDDCELPCMFVCVCVCVCVCVLEIKPGSSGRIAGVLNYRAISPTPAILSFKNIYLDL